MKEIKAFAILIFVIFVPSAYSQELSTGFFSGINFSDIHGNDISGKWKFKPGPATGINVNYSFNGIFGVQTGLNYSVINYEHKSYPNGSIWIDYSGSGSYYPYQSFEMMNFSYFTLPAQLKISIPSKPQLDLSAGMFYSFLLGYGPSYENVTKPAENDYGYIYSVGLSYPLKDNLKVSLNTNYLTGRKNIYKSLNLKNGSMDFMIGITYNGFLKNREKIGKPVRDSVNPKVYVVYFGGISLLWNSGKEDHGRYSSNFSPSLGFLLNLQWSPKSSFQTGLSFERTGYSLKDSSNVFYGYIDNGARYYVDTRMTIDYIVLPAIVNFTIGRSGRFFFNTGPYLGVKLNAKCTGEAYHALQTNNQYTYEKTTVYDDMEGAIKNCDFGWIFGGGVTVPFSNKMAVDLGLQYKAGMINVFNKQFFTESARTENTIRNGVLSLRIGLRVPALKRSGIE